MSPPFNVLREAYRLAIGAPSIIAGEGVPRFDLEPSERERCFIEVPEKPGGPTNLFKGLADLCREVKGLESLDLSIARAGTRGGGEARTLAGRPCGSLTAMISDISATSILQKLEAIKAEACAAEVMNGMSDADYQLFQ